MTTAFPSEELAEVMIDIPHAGIHLTRGNLENDISALNVGPHVFASRRGKRLPQSAHFNLCVSGDIDRAQECNIFRHRGYPG
jgi:hypothetical protein